MILKIVVTQNSTYNVPGISDGLLQQLCRPEFDNTRSAVNSSSERFIVILSMYSLWKWRRFRCCAGIVTAFIITWSQEQVCACKSDGGVSCMVRSYNNADLCYASNDNDVTGLFEVSRSPILSWFFIYIFYVFKSLIYGQVHTHTLWERERERERELRTTNMVLTF